MVAESANTVPEYTLVVSEKGNAERRLAFRVGELTVGRVQGNEVVLPKGNVSKRHARILYREGRFIVTDLNSTNGTYVNRQRIAQATIVREEDTILIGDFSIRVELLASEPPPSDPATPRREFEAPIPTLTPAPTWRAKRRPSITRVTPASLDGSACLRPTTRPPVGPRVRRAGRRSLRPPN